ncbi:NAD(P)-dependent oxidoreductase [Jatrophihabitans sp. DSM 45814]
MAPTVFVVQPIPEPALEALRTVADVEVYPYSDRMVTTDELTAVAQRCEYIFAMHETMIPAEVFGSSSILKGIIVGGREVADMIDVGACERAGVTLIHTAPDSHGASRKGNAKATADLTLALLLSVAYRVAEADRYTRAGGFRQEMTMDLMGLGCTDKVAGIVGMGRVARELVPRLKAVDMHVIYTKRTRLSADEERELGIEWVPELPVLLERSDYVTMLANYNESTHMLMGAKEFALMKPSAYFINPGRGRLVDEPAMIAALQDGTIAGAGLDVFWAEPPVTHDPFVPTALRKLDNVVLTPHNGGATWDSRTRQTLGMADSLAAHLTALA